MSFVHTRKIAKETIKLQIQHNYDEVKPLVSIFFNAGDVSIVLKNQGLGPAIFTSMKWIDKENNEEFDSLNDLIKYKSNIGEFQDLIIYHIYTKKFWDVEEDMDLLAPQEELCLFRIEDNEKITREENKANAAKILRNVEVIITLTNIYRSDIQTIKKNCTWFWNIIHGNDKKSNMD